jgi:16S rRNA G966 N2-methylase RsmD
MLNDGKSEEFDYVSYNDIKRLLPDAKYYNGNGNWVSEVQLTNEGLSSITPFKIARNISLKFKRILNDNKRSSTCIVDTSANVGGNTISFSQYFDKVICYEIKTKTYNVLRKNLDVYGITNVQTVNADFIKNIKNISKNVNMVFIDPPWYLNGRPNRYLSLSDCYKPYLFPITEVICRLWDHSPKIIIAIKVPKNYKIPINESTCIPYKKMDILIFIY